MFDREKNPDYDAKLAMEMEVQPRSGGAGSVEAVKLYWITGMTFVLALKVILLKLAVK